MRDLIIKNVLSMFPMATFLLDFQQLVESLRPGTWARVPIGASTKNAVVVIVDLAIQEGWIEPLVKRIPRNPTNQAEIDSILALLANSGIITRVREPTPSERNGGQSEAERSVSSLPQGKAIVSESRKWTDDLWRRIAGRGGWRVLVAGLVVAAVVAVGRGVWCQPPTFSVPVLPARRGVVVTGGRLDSGGRDAWQHLCTALRELGEQAVQCVAPPAPPDEELIAAARAAAASLVITVEAGPVARVLPVPGRDGEQFLRELPAVSIARPETRTALTQIAYVLALGPRDVPPGVADGLPIKPDRVIPWRVTALAALARMWTQAKWEIQDRAELAGIARRCRGERASVADAHCALIHYVLYAEVAPDAPDAGPRLDELIAQGPRGIADVATLYVLRQRCIKEPARTRIALLELAQRVDECQRWYLMTPATCVLMADNRSGADSSGSAGGADDAAIRALAEPSEHAGDPCPDDVRAGAYYDRAHWLAERWNASTREEWEQAVESYELAFKLDPSPDYAQGLAEALLFLRQHAPDRAEALARQAVDVLDHAAVVEPTAAFLAWMADNATNADGQARLCKIYHGLRPGEIAVPHVSLRLACPGGDLDDAVGCRVHRLLSAPKLADRGALEASVCSNNEGIEP